MNGKIVILLSLLFIAFIPRLTLGAKEKPNVVLKLSAQKEVIVKDERGKARTEWQEVQSFQPGELARYTITYRNEGAGEARNVVIVDPIPAGTSYLQNGAEGENADITFSMDGRNFQPQPLLKYKVKAQGGREQEMVATPEMYTHIKWKITKAVPPGGAGSVSFKVKIR